ncbi:MAG TPA: phosphoglucomutase/phosphomannomutase family protein, partial [Thermoanaerobaculia bacterium]|nr:phosphoglucomutase/phosphomannomutase family protein [Thermoanaerobaculia bacterium]
ELSADLAREIGPYFSRRLDLSLSPEARPALARHRASPPQRLASRKVVSVNRVDGMKLLLEDGSWILVRESGTEPVARVYVEARSEKDLAALADAGRELLG